MAEDKPETPETPKPNTSELDKLKAHNAELEAELVKGRALQAEARSIEAEKMRGGKSNAGQEPKPKTEDEKWAEGAKERYAGTGLDPTPDEDKQTTYS